jgi:hypothetical protein
MGTSWARFVSDEIVARQAEASKAAVGASWPFMQVELLARQRKSSCKFSKLALCKPYVQFYTHEVCFLSVPIQVFTSAQ